MLKHNDNTVVVHIRFILEQPTHMFKPWEMDETTYYVEDFEVLTDGDDIDSPKVNEALCHAISMGICFDKMPVIKVEQPEP
jgi:hypothetical protein